MNFLYSSLKGFALIAIPVRIAKHILLNVHKQIRNVERFLLEIHDFY